MARRPSPTPGELVERFRAARRDPCAAVLEGFHPLKHALRFGAEIVEARAFDPGAVVDLARRLAPELVPILDGLIGTVPRGTFSDLAPVPPPTGIVAIARRPIVEARDVLDAMGEAPVVLVDSPARLGNLGAAVRVAAAVGAAGVLAVGEHDPWHPDALRGAAGLQFALPVARVGSVPEFDLHGRPLVAIDPEGEPLSAARIQPRALLAFGSERHGLSPSLLAHAERRLAIPMRPGVSSLNLATAVAVVLYTWRLGRGTS